MANQECLLEQVVLDLLNEKKFEDALHLLKSSENEVKVKDSCWNLITAVCSTLKTNQLLQDASDISTCEAIVLLLSEKGNPKEILVALLEQADSFKDDEFFCFLLNPLQSTLKKVPGKRGKSLQWTLSTLNAHIESLPLPEDLDLEGEEKLLLDLDPAVQRTNYVIVNYLDFLKVFVDEVSFDTTCKKEFVYVDRVSNQREILQKYILKLFDRPFLYQDLHIEDTERPKSTIRVSCEKSVSYLKSICRNFFDFYKFNLVLEADQVSNDDFDMEDESVKVSKLAISNLIYLMLVENIATDNYPSVYSNKHIFLTNLSFAMELLSKKEHLVLIKGLLLSKALLDKLSDFELHHSCMEMDLLASYPKLLLNIAIYSQAEDHRKAAVALIYSFINKFDWNGRYHQIMHIISTVEHSGSHGLVINMYKDFLHINIEKNASPNIFLGKNLQMFLQKTFVLPEGAETDILEWYDKIITALNLLRYLLLKDSKEINMTGIWNQLDKINNRFLVPLQTGLDLSRAHYKLKLKELRNRRHEEKTQLINSLSVNKQRISDMPPDIQKCVGVPDK